MSRFCSSGEEREDEPDDKGIGPQDAEISGRIEPLGAQGAALGSIEARDTMGQSRWRLIAPVLDGIVPPDR